MKKHLRFVLIFTLLLAVTGFSFARAGGGQSYGGSRGYSEEAGIIGTGGLLGLLPILVLAFFIILISLVRIISQWKIFEKAGQAGWASIIPVYNKIILLRVSQKPEWWVILYIIPIASTVIGIMVSIALAESFGKDTGFAIGIILLPIVFYPMLAFGDSTYSNLLNSPEHVC